MASNDGPTNQPKADSPTRFIARTESDDGVLGMRMETTDPLLGRRMQAIFSNDRIADAAGLEHLKSLNVMIKPENDVSKFCEVLKGAGLTVSEELLGEIVTFLAFDPSFEELELELIDRVENGEALSRVKRRDPDEYSLEVSRILDSLPVETRSTGEDLAARLKGELGVEAKFCLVNSFIAELDPAFVILLPDKLNEISPESNHKEISVSIQRRRSEDTSGLPEEFLLTDLPLMIQAKFVVLHDSFSRIKEVLEG